MLIFCWLARQCPRARSLNVCRFTQPSQRGIAGFIAQAQTASAVTFHDTPPDIFQGWHHFGVSYKAATGRILSTLDGKVMLDDVSIPNIGALVAEQGALTLGQDQDALLGSFDESGWMGTFDELRIWNHFRSGEEIRSTMYESLSVAEVDASAGSGRLEGQLYSLHGFDDGSGTSADGVLFFYLPAS